MLIRVDARIEGRMAVVMMPGYEKIEREKGLCS